MTMPGSTSSIEKIRAELACLWVRDLRAVSDFLFIVGPRFPRSQYRLRPRRSSKIEVPFLHRPCFVDSVIRLTVSRVGACR